MLKFMKELQEVRRRDERDAARRATDPAARSRLRSPTSFVFGHLVRG
jgi:hypothetical protein